jgi:hypothetical protein
VKLGHGLPITHPTCSRYDARYIVRSHSTSKRRAPTHLKGDARAESARHTARYSIGPLDEDLSRREPPTSPQRVHRTCTRVDAAIHAIAPLTRSVGTFPDIAEAGGRRAISTPPPTPPNDADQPPDPDRAEHGLRPVPDTPRLGGEHWPAGWFGWWAGGSLSGPTGGATARTSWAVGSRFVAWFVA